MAHLINFIKLQKSEVAETSKRFNGNPDVCMNDSKWMETDVKNLTKVHT